VKTHPVECRECGNCQLSDWSCCTECGANNLRPTEKPVENSFGAAYGRWWGNGWQPEVEDLVELVERHELRRLSMDEVRERLLWDRGVE
jgi:hypothetical protein